MRHALERIGQEMLAERRAVERKEKLNLGKPQGEELKFGKLKAEMGGGWGKRSKGQAI
jgi:hypothetical protein